MCLIRFYMLINSNTQVSKNKASLIEGSLQVSPSPFPSKTKRNPVPLCLCFENCNVLCNQNTCSNGRYYYIRKENIIIFKAVCSLDQLAQKECKNSFQEESSSFVQERGKTVIGKNDYKGENNSVRSEIQNRR